MDVSEIQMLRHVYMRDIDMHFRNVDVHLRDFDLGEVELRELDPALWNFRNSKVGRESGALPNKKR
jgi:hypothetical protein